MRLGLAAILVLASSVAHADLSLTAEFELRAPFGDEVREPSTDEALQQQEQ